MARPRRGRAGTAAIAGCAALGALAAADPPAAAAEGGVSVRDLVEITDISGLAASPDGRFVAFRTERAAIDRNSYILSWHILSTKAQAGGPSIVDAGGGGEPIYLDPGLLATERAFWSPDSRFIFYRARVDDRIGLWRAARDGSAAAPAVERDEDLEAVEAEPGGRSLLYRIGPSRDEVRRSEALEYDQGILVDEHVDLAQNLFRGASINGRMASQRLTGHWFERKELLWRAPRHLRRLDLMTLEDSESSAAPPDPATAPSAPQVAATSSAGDVATAAWHDGTGSLVVRRKGRSAPIACLADPCVKERIAAVEWRPGRNELLLTTQDRHQAQALYLWAIGDKAPRRIAGSDGLLSGGRDPDLPCAVTEAAAYCVAASAVSPPQLVRVDLETSVQTIVYDPNALERTRSRVTAERLDWTTREGSRFTGVLILPAGARARSLPLFLTFYRCEGFLRGGVGDEWPLEPLAEAGFAVACVNNPPIVGPYDPVATYERALAGLRSLVAGLARRGIADPRRVGMGGLSFGSEVTMWTALHSDLLAAASIASTQPEPGYYWFNAVRGRDQPAVMKKAWGLGAPDETSRRWREVSPALNTARLKAPLLLQLPEQEARYVVELYARLTNSTTPAELYVYPDEAHLKLQPRHKLAAYQRNLDWFRFWLKGEADPDSSKAPQYERWRALAERRSAPPSVSPGSQP